MKRLNHLYEKVYDIENLRLAHKNASKGKGWYQEVKMINKDPDYYLYQLQDNSIPFEGMPEPAVLEDYWNTRVEYIYKLSNLYAANSIPVKLRSIGIDPDTVDSGTKLTGRQIEILSRIEHNSAVCGIDLDYERGDDLLAL